MVDNTLDYIREPNGEGGLGPAGSGWWPHRTGEDSPKRIHAVRYVQWDGGRHMGTDPSSHES